MKPETDGLHPHHDGQRAAVKAENAELRRRAENVHQRMTDDTDDDCGAQTVSRRECEHGSLARKCLICELEAENAELLAKVETAKAESKNWQHSMGLAIEERDETIADLEHELSTLRESMPVCVGYVEKYDIEILRSYEIDQDIELYICKENSPLQKYPIYVDPTKPPEASSSREITGT